MDLTWTAEDQAFRAQARAWLEANVPTDPLPSGDTRAGFAAHLDWERRLHAARWSVVSWPERYGGRDVNPWQWLVFEEEYYRAGAPQRVTQNGIFLLAPAVFRFGTPEQQARILPRMAAAQDLWCQGWSEPGAGSDLASLTSRAVRDEAGGGWRLSGQKTWSTRGAFCTHVFGLFRTGAGDDPEVRRHRGLTYFLVPLDAPGVTVHGFSRLDGDEGFADLFFDDVFVPDADVLGPVHGGWKVAMATAAGERGLTLRSPGRFLAAFERLRSAALAAGPDPAIVDRLVESWLDVQAYARHTDEVVTRIVAGEPVGAEASLSKLHWSELDVRLHELALDVLGAGAQTDGSWTRGFQFSLSGPIYAGTNEIQRDIVAERLLGLPRSR
ncbi:acyl-CoA dehydrogenase family protein [Spongisporangium articulatum]|uniref:Acyl-CoA dehydrogenase family protein n=1 Tax=Spongisporangium articulatum TaxID=3362603 RepID=A0ABW8AUL0_9ACTN